MAILAGCSPTHQTIPIPVTSTLVPSSTMVQRLLSVRREALTVVFRSGESADYPEGTLSSIKVFSGKQFLSLRRPGGEGLIPLASVRSVKTRLAQNGGPVEVQPEALWNPYEPPDPGNGGSNSPISACAFDASMSCAGDPFATPTDNVCWNGRCGDNPDGSVLGSISIDFGSGFYCTFDLSTDTPNCVQEYAANSSSPQDLFVSMSRSQGWPASITCRNPGGYGRAFVYYRDAESSAIGVRHFVNNGKDITFVYPRDFPGLGKPYSSGVATYHSNWYYLGIPLPNFKVGVCNHTQ
jgi:hypothetical protein